MRETRFIEQNKAKWVEFEQLLNQPNVHPDDLQRMYIQLTDDLSFARTFYPNRSVRVYLNFLAQKVFSNLYKIKKSPLQKFVSYWKTDLPQLVWEARWEFLLAFGVFMLAVSIGVLSTMIDADFPRIILGDDYVNQTLENIRKGDPMAIYKQGSGVSNTLGITSNNIFVALRTFVMGIFAGIGTIVILLQNGIMLGSFQYFFVSRGIGLEATLAIWLHGTFEISAIIIAGAAGLTLGKGILFPATYTRIQSFQRALRRGFEIMTGIVPLFLVAGLVEGLFTRYTDAPTIVRGGFIVSCAAFVVFYFVYYPYRLSKKGFASPLEDIVIPPDDTTAVKMLRIRSSKEIFTDTFAIFRNIFGTILSLSGIFALIYICLFFFLAKGKPTQTVFLPNDNISDYWQIVASYLFGKYAYFLAFFNNENVPFLWLLNAMTFSLFTNIVIIKIKKAENPEYGIDFKNFILQIFILLPSNIAFCYLLSVSSSVSVFFILISILSITLLWIWNSSERKNPIAALGNAFAGTFGQFFYCIGITLIMLLVGMLFYSVSISFFLGILEDFFSMQIYSDTSIYGDFLIGLKSFIVMFTTFVVYAFFLICGGLLYNSTLEIESAESLLERIGEISLKRNVKGLEME
jgi:uncharacterized membrane protein SpoIIM required for sporulation